MKTDVETTGSEKDLTVTRDGKQESTIESTEPAEGRDLPEGAKNWQHALQLAREREQAKEAELAEYRAKLDEVKAEEKRRSLADLPEIERYKSIAEEESQKRGKLEMRQIVLEAVSGKNIPGAIKDLLLNSPWAIPAVSEELGSTYTWDEAIASVRRHLPAYISLITASEDKPSTPSEESVRRVDTERSTGISVVKDHFYTQDEIDKMSPEEYEKHRDKILRQMATNKGKL